MSGFQIPGLGFAKPNETLPPLPPDVLAAAASFEGVQTADDVKVKQEGEVKNEDVKMEDGEVVETAEVKTEDAAVKNEDVKMEESAHPSTSEPQLPPLPEPTNSEAMKIDAAEPPSLTDALEAMINGLEPAATTTTATATTTTTDQPAAAAAAEEQPAAEGEHPEWEIDSSPCESSSESSSSSDDSSDDDSESGEGYQLLGVEETARMLMEMEGGSDDEGGDGAAKAGGSGQLRTKNEVAAEAIPKPDITLTPEDKIEALGAVDQIVENIMVVKAFTPGEYQVLDTGSALCTAERVVFGAVWETIGKVLQPMYTVLFNTAEEIGEAGLEVGSKVYYPPAHATFVFTEPLKNLKGSDASNIHDEEVAEDEMEFSDDEKEAEHKRQAKQKKKEARFKNGGERPARGGREPHPLRNEISAAGPSDGGLNYDDEDDGPYKPLARPPGFGQVPPAQQSFSQEPEPGRFAGRRGRGDFRGRGDRGRGGRGRGRGGFGQREGRDGYSMPQQQRQQQPQGQWGGNNNNYYQAPQYGQQQQQQQQQQQSAPAPAAPTFNFPFPGMPPQPGAQGFPAVPPPPPPGWPAQGGQTGQNAAGAYINPAFFAALLGQMQQNQGPAGQQSQQQQGQSQQPPQPPHQWGAQPPPQ
ncbi:hypothetical protein CkaCkLH20_07891 [Colletotrichum karsti]|uniref:H/ACA ribonucleoprotein complex non-core subunit NAF1 n=1 Tax=Colletotrichum karsti TaxID=1095194 RepID=A0A9P6LG26_9PEZI|nr:uncharacterized protein CkaCkLH20_07891 [Colletotrichum karsti]KAF9874754.1 hypothetical protein CkaCkLH20_07891 [Colletotrichum karsti]